MVTLDELLGYTTAIGSATRESGNIVGNSLKTIFARITTNDNAISALSDIGISINDLEGNVRPVSEILNELAGRWGALSDAQRQNVSTSVAGIYQLSRFNALLNNYDTALSASASATNSFNSAVREQEQYSKSLEGRINRLNTEWVQFSSTVGDQVLYDGIVVVTEVLGNLADGGDSVISGVGVLAPAFATLATGALLLSTNLRTLAVSTYSTVSASVAATGGASLLTRGLAGLTAASTVATGAIARFFLPFAGFIAVATALGFAVEKLTNSYSGYIQQQEELDRYNEKGITALTQNREVTEELIDRYNQLSAARARGEDFNVAKQQEFVDIQQTLAEIYPALIERVDSTGQAHLKNTEAIAGEVAITQQLIDAQNKLLVNGSQGIFDDLLTPISGNFFESIGNFFNGSLQDQIDEKQLQIKLDEAFGIDTSELELELLQLQQQFVIANDEIKANIYEIIAAFAALNNVSIDNGVSGVIQGFVQSLDLSGLDANELSEFTNRIAELQVELQKSADTGNQDLFKTARDSLNSLGGEFDNFNLKTNGVSLSYDEFIKVIENGENALGYVDTELDSLNGSLDETGSSAVDLTETLRDFNSVIEETAGISSKGVEALGDLLFQYNALSGQLAGYTDAELQAIYTSQNLTDVEREVKDVLSQRIGVMQSLASAYPELLSQDGKSISLSQEKINAITNENRANKTLLDAYKLSRDGKLNAEQNATLASAQGTKGRIENIRREIQALNLLNEALRAYVNNENIANDDNAARGAIRASNIIANNVGEIGNYDAELTALQSSLFSTTDSIGGFVKSVNEAEKSTKSKSESTKKETQALKESIYVTDEYKNALEALNLEQAKYQKLINDYPTYSNTYRKALEAQIKLKKQEIALQKQQSAELEKQVRTGNVQQTGLIEIDDGKAVTKKVTRGISGAQGRITSVYGAQESFRNAPHTGIDIANPRGTRLDSFTDGRVVGQGYNSRSGNYVKIEDSEGYRHFYAHLDETFAKIGDALTAGTQIGTIGSTGNSTGPHLHYQVANSRGTTIDPTNFLNQARNGVVSTTSSSSSREKSASTIAAENAQAIDKTASDLRASQSLTLKKLEELDALYAQLRQSFLDGFENRRSRLDSEISYEDAKIRNVDRYSTQYNATLEKQTDLLRRKQNVNNEEIAYLDKLIADGGIPATEVAEYTARISDLRTDILALGNEIQNSVESYLAVFDTDRNFADNEIQSYNSRLQELDTNSTAYIRTLDGISSALENKQRINRDELAFLDKQIASGNYSGEVLVSLTNRYEQLTNSVKDLGVEIKKANYEVIVNIRTRYDERIDDRDFQLQRSRAIQGFYDEGSADYLREYDYQIDKLNELIKLQEAYISETQKAVAEQRILPEDIKRTNEELEDASLALLGYQGEILGIQKAISESSKKQQDDFVKQQEDVANRLINAYKDYLQERKDTVIKGYEDEIKAENKRYNNVIDNINKERDAFKDAVDERLRLIDRTESQRSYDEDIRELQGDRSKIQDSINRLALDDSRETASRRKDLQEQLDEIDKQIEDTRRAREIELQKQNLNDLVELKDEELTQKEILEKNANDKEIQRIEGLKTYYDQYYTDLLNDEREFARIREEIVAGNYDAIKGEFGEYVTYLEDSLPGLENTFDGSMKAVGTTIRQNVIDNLKETLSLLKDVQTSSVLTNQYGSSASFDSSGRNFTNPSFETSSSASDSSSQVDREGLASFNQGDQKVLLGKYINDVIAVGVSSNSRRANIKEKGYAIAAEGRAEGSSIPANIGVNDALSQLSKNQLNELSNFVSNNNAGFVTPDYQDAVKSWASELRRRAASLNTGGLINGGGRGIDGIGGRSIIVHPNEVVNTPYDVNQLVQTASVSQRAAELFTPILRAFSNPTSLLSGVNGASGDVYNFEFNVDKLVGNEQGLNNALKGVYNQLRTQRGMK